MSYRETEHLRVLIANERKDRLALVAPIVAGLGHEVIAREVEVDDVGPVTARERPDVALVGLGESSQHALTLIEKIVQESACPVIVLIHAPDPAFVREASKRGIFAYITDAEPEDWQSSIDIVLRRFTEYHDLEGAFGRRAITERAKGILMERHSVDEAAAFEMLRDHSRAANRKLVDIASAVVDGHPLLPKASELRSLTGRYRRTPLRSLEPLVEDEELARRGEPRRELRRHLLERRRADHLVAEPGVPAAEALLLRVDPPLRDEQLELHRRDAARAHQLLR